jgi:hypothetical protein
MRSVSLYTAQIDNTHYSAKSRSHRTSIYAGFSVTDPARKWPKKAICNTSVSLTRWFRLCRPNTSIWIPAIAPVYFRTIAAHNVTPGIRRLARGGPHIQGTVFPARALFSQSPGAPLNQAPLIWCSVLGKRCHKRTVGRSVEHADSYYFQSLTSAVSFWQAPCHAGVDLR